MAEVAVLENDASITVAVTGNGQVEFDFDFLAYDASHVRAVHTTLAGVETDLENVTDFSVSGLAQVNGGSIDITASGIATVIGETILIFRQIPIERANDYSTEFRAATVNREFDTLFMILQEARRDLDRSAKAALGEPGIEIEAGDDGDILEFVDGRLVPRSGLPASISAAALATATGLPLAITASTWLRGNAGATAYDAKTDQQALDLLAAGNVTLPDTDAEAFPLSNYLGETLMPWAFKASGDPDDTLSIQRMLSALGARTTRRHCRIPQQSYEISGAIAQPAGSVVEAAGAEFVCDNSGATARTWWTINGSKSALLGARFLGEYTGYKSGDRAVSVTGSANGAGVAPTYIEDVVLDLWGVENFAEGAIRAAYVIGLIVDLRRAYNLGYFGMMGLSCHDVRARVNIDTVLGAAGTSWNAYGIAATADTSSVDLSRYPPSSEWDISGKIKSIPEWHGADTHGGKFIKFHDLEVIDCRRGIILTTLSTAGGEAEDCTIENCRIKNTLTGANAVSLSNKNDGALWDVGVDTTNRNKRNVIRGNNIWGHGSPTIALGAFTSQYADDGVYEENVFRRPYYAGVSVRGGNNRILLRDNTVIDPHTSGTHASAFPVGIRFEAANWHDVSLIRNDIIAQDDTIDTNVAEVGILIDATANRTIHSENNMIHPDVTTAWSVGAGGGITGVFA